MNLKSSSIQNQEIVKNHNDLYLELLLTDYEVILSQP